MACPWTSAPSRTAPHRRRNAAAAGRGGKPPRNAPRNSGETPLAHPDPVPASPPVMPAVRTRRSTMRGFVSPIPIAAAPSSAALAADTPRPARGTRFPLIRRARPNSSRTFPPTGSGRMSAPAPPPSCISARTGSSRTARAAPTARDGACPGRNRNGPSATDASGPTRKTGFDPGSRLSRWLPFIRPAAGAFARNDIPAGIAESRIRDLRRNVRKAAIDIAHRPDRGGTVPGADRGTTIGVSEARCARPARGTPGNGAGAGHGSRQRPGRP